MTIVDREEWFRYSASIPRPETPPPLPPSYCTYNLYDPTRFSFLSIKVSSRERVNITSFGRTTNSEHRADRSVGRPVVTVHLRFSLRYLRPRWPTSVDYHVDNREHRCLPVNLTRVYYSYVKSCADCTQRYSTYSNYCRSVTTIHRSVFVLNTKQSFPFPFSWLHCEAYVHCVCLYDKNIICYWILRVMFVCFTFDLPVDDGRFTQRKHISCFTMILYLVHETLMWVSFKKRVLDTPQRNVLLLRDKLLSKKHRTKRL